MKPVLTIFQLLALLGFILSAAAHLGSIFGIKIFSGAENLHLGIFVVFIPAFIVHSNTYRRNRRNQRNSWKILLQGCPSWMKSFTSGLFAYIIANFIYFLVYVSPQIPKDIPGGMPPEVIRAFSGHWMLFYWIAFAALYSAVHAKEPAVKTCPGCKSDLSPQDKFCPNCGMAIAVDASNNQLPPAELKALVTPKKLLGALFIAALFLALFKIQKNETVRKPGKDQLPAIAAQLKKGLQASEEQASRRYDVTHDSSSLTIHGRLPATDKATVEGNLPTMRKNSLAWICREYSRLMSEGVTVRFKYYDGNGDPLVEEVYTHAECPSP